MTVISDLRFSANDGTGPSFVTGDDVKANILGELLRIMIYRAIFSLCGLNSCEPNVGLSQRFVSYRYMEQHESACDVSGGSLSAR